MQCPAEGCTARMGKDTFPAHLPRCCQGDSGTILLSEATSVTAHPNLRAREGALPASRHPRSPTLTKPGASRGHATGATRSQGGCDTEVRGWGPQVLTSRPRCTGMAAYRCLR